MQVDKLWWKKFFNATYLITDARTVCNPNLTRDEVTLLEKTLSLHKHDTILDFCGGYGRHSLELAKRGYRQLTVLDFSSYLIKLGKELAQKDKLNTIRFLKRDARCSGLKSNTYSVIFMMANSFGYFRNERENVSILKEVSRILKKGGKLLLDLIDPHYARTDLKPFSWHEADNDVIVCRERQLRGNIVKAREIVLSKKKGLLRDGFYCMKLYNQRSILHLLKKTGFKVLSIRKNVSLHKKKKDYGLITSRMFVTATKT